MTENQSIQLDIINIDQDLGPIKLQMRLEIEDLLPDFLFKSLRLQNSNLFLGEVLRVAHDVHVIQILVIANILMRCHSRD